MKFETYIPCEALRPYVKQYIVQETDEEQTYTVLPDTGLVIGFQYKGRLARLDDEQETPLANAGISGLADQYRVFKNSADIGTVLVFFHAAGAAVFFRQPLHELFRESISLDNFLLRSELLLLEEQLCEAATGAARMQVVERFLLSRMTNIEPDKLVLAALTLIHKYKGSIRMKNLAEQLHTSQSPLEKRFRQVVGASPKKFASIVRFKHTLQAYHATGSLTELGYEAGFYDQAHFIKEFRQFTGEAPETFFRKQ